MGMELLTICAAALCPNIGLILTSIRKGLQLSLIRANRRDARAIAHACGAKLRGASRSQNVMRVAEWGCKLTVLPGHSLLGRMGERNPRKFNGRVSKVCPTP